ncbi:hypothetical protein Tco_1317603 [Tanacetum coccineum]
MRVTIVNAHKHESSMFLKKDINEWMATIGGAKVNGEIKMTSSKSIDDEESILGCDGYLERLWEMEAQVDAMDVE